KPEVCPTGAKVRVALSCGLLYWTVGLGMRSGLLENARTLSRSASLAAPELMPVNSTVCGPEPSAMVRLAIGFRVGGLFIGVTVTVKLRAVLSTMGCPPEAMTVTVA